MVIFEGLCALHHTIESAWDIFQLSGKLIALRLWNASCLVSAILMLLCPSLSQIGSQSTRSPETARSLQRAANHQLLAGHCDGVGYRHVRCPSFAACSCGTSSSQRSRMVPLNLHARHSRLDSIHEYIGGCRQYIDISRFPRLTNSASYLPSQTTRRILSRALMCQLKPSQIMLSSVKMPQLRSGGVCADHLAAKQTGTVSV
ncbi:unnamed protein product [Mycena citricolor]|uniref:Uncharacterized protein n=1 Tax=Mycena citricolor TaxID=2018698 RepID=A0AAD2HPD8_9AGAR|nr:unnamed protein product [Mycena citricolor]